MAWGFFLRFVTPGGGTENHEAQAMGSRSRSKKAGSYPFAGAPGNQVDILFEQVATVALLAGDLREDSRFFKSPDQVAHCFLGEAEPRGDVGGADERFLKEKIDQPDGMDT